MRLRLRASCNVCCDAGSVNVLGDLTDELLGPKEVMKDRCLDIEYCEAINCTHPLLGSPARAEAQPLVPVLCNPVRAGCRGAAARPYERRPTGESADHRGGDALQGDCGALLLCGQRSPKLGVHRQRSVEVPSGTPCGRGTRRRACRSTFIASADGLYCGACSERMTWVINAFSDSDSTGGLRSEGFLLIGHNTIKHWSVTQKAIAYPQETSMQPRAP